MLKISLFVMYVTWVPVPPGQMGDNNMPPVMELTPRYDTVAECEERRDFLNNFWGRVSVQGQAKNLKAFCVGGGATSENPQPSDNTPLEQENNGWPGLSASSTAFQFYRYENRR